MEPARCRSRILVTGIAFLALFVALQPARGPEAHADEPIIVEVTSSGDGTTAACPHPANCTLRKAIEAVNADTSATPYVIRFKAATFPPDNPTTIAVLATPLPAITRAKVTVDATGRGVLIDGAQLPATGTFDGIVVSGSEASVWGMVIRNFSGRCLALTGPSSHAGGSTAEGKGNRVGPCGTGIAIAGANSTVEGNRVGFDWSTADPAHVDAGIVVTASSVVVGGSDGAIRGNVVGNAATAIKVGTGAGGAFSGVLIARNTIGKTAAGATASVTTGIDLRQPSTRTRIEENTIANAATGISVAPIANTVPVTGNTMVANHFDALTGLAIDLDADGIRNSNFPALTKTTQARISGSAGPCTGCLVALYLAAHHPGGGGDYGAIPIAGGTATTDAAGSFQFDNLGIPPGQWVIVLLTDLDGNTGEFGPSARVGTGVVQCTNQPLKQGWNHTGYFGSGVTSLGSSYPPGANQVSAIYRLNDGSASFSSWFASSSEARTLYSLTPGDSYWLYATEPVPGSGGFTLTVPVPVELKAGWNDFTYIGATADVRDALASIAGKYSSLYRFVNDGASAQWQAWGEPTTPDFARAFTTIESCGTYEVFLASDATLTPLQP